MPDQHFAVAKDSGETVPDPRGGEMSVTDRVGAGENRQVFISGFTIRIYGRSEASTIDKGHISGAF